MFSFLEAAGKIAREEGKHDLGPAPEDSFPDNLSVPPPAAAELVGNPHGGSRSERAAHAEVLHYPSAPAPTGFTVSQTSLAPRAAMTALQSYFNLTSLLSVAQ